MEQGGRQLARQASARASPVLPTGASHPTPAPRTRFSSAMGNALPQFQETHGQAGRHRPLSPLSATSRARPSLTVGVSFIPCHWVLPPRLKEHQCLRTETGTLVVSQSAMERLSVRRAELRLGMESKSHFVFYTCHIPRAQKY